jgi:hypothetical protein
LLPPISVIILKISDLIPSSVSLFVKSGYVAKKRINLFLLLEEYEITDNANDYVISSEIQEWLDEKKIGITMKKFGMEIKRYILKNNLRNVRSDVKRIFGINKNIWIGIKYLSEQ